MFKNIKGPGSLHKDPSKKALKTSEEITSITGIKTMMALAPSLSNSDLRHRRTSCT